MCRAPTRSTERRARLRRCTLTDGGVSYGLTVTATDVKGTRVDVDVDVDASPLTTPTP